jgi:four helix bundle protein
VDTTNSDLNRRTRTFALRIVRLYSALPKSAEVSVIGKQLLRSGTSVGAHYSEANFAKSNKDFINKIEGALQELEETVYWLALMEDAKIGKLDQLTQLQKECRELIAIFVTIAKKVKSK